MNVIPQSGVSWGFNPGDVFANSGNLVHGVGEFIILGLALMFAPKLIGFIRGIFSKEDEGEEGFVQRYYDLDHESDGNIAWLHGEDDGVKESRLLHYYDLDSHNETYDEWREKYLNSRRFRDKFHDDHWGSGWSGYEDD